jgi:ABC-type amino acid transport substrate-binding protein
MTHKTTLILFIIFYSFNISLAASDTHNISLTQEEIIWIQNHPNIVVGADNDFPPFDFVANGEATGFSNDYLRLLAEKAGLNIQFVHGFQWAKLIEMAKLKQIDIPTNKLKGSQIKHESCF